MTRRGFIRQTVATGIALTGLSSFQSCSGYNSKGLPTAVFGRTGIHIPRIAIGLGSRFCSVSDEDEALEILSCALDNGIYYWDTAHSYINRELNVVSEERIGKILKDRRKEVFLSTKVAGREPDVAMEQIEISLKRLQTDHVDNLMLHNIGSINDVDLLSKRGGVIELITRMKEEGVTRFIGFSGHSNAEALRQMIERGDFDNVLFAMNQYENYSQNRQEEVIPAAQEKNMGVLLMKVIRPKENITGISASELIRYALSLEGLTGLVIGMDSVEVARSNIELLRSFTPMTAAEQSAVSSILSPVMDEKYLEWTKPGYKDGYWV